MYGQELCRFFITIYFIKQNNSHGGKWEWTHSQVKLFMSWFYKNINCNSLPLLLLWWTTNLGGFFPVSLEPPQAKGPYWPSAFGPSSLFVMNAYSYAAKLRSNGLDETLEVEECCYLKTYYHILSLITTWALLN